MSNDLEDLKRDITSSKSISKEDREEMLSDLRGLEEDNKRYAQMKLDEIELKYKKQKDFAIFCLIVGALAILYTAYKYW